MSFEFVCQTFASMYFTLLSYDKRRRQAGMAALSAFSDTHGDVERVLLVSGVVGRRPLGTAVGSG